MRINKWIVMGVAVSAAAVLTVWAVGGSKTFRTTIMQALIPYLPIIAVIVVYAVRIAEVRAKRQTVAGKVQETTTFNLFLIIGTLIDLGCQSTDKAMSPATRPTATPAVLPRATRHRRGLGSL